MMRLNAPLPALLALAVLFLIPAMLLAKPVHRHVHKTAVVSRHSKPKPQQARSRRSSKASKASAVPMKHVRSHAGKRRHHRVRTVKTKSRRSEPGHLKVSKNASGKATAADFLKAATTKSGDRDAPVSHHAEPATTVSHSRAPDRKDRAVAKSIPVVSVIRPTPEEPQMKSIAEDAATPAILPVLYNKRGRLIIPPPLKGSHEILLHQNEVADREGLDRIQNDTDLLDMRKRRMLVPLPSNYALGVDDRLPENRRYCRPWTSQFLANLSRAHYAHFHTQLQINSAVRTAEFQQHLIRINGNAAPAEGDTASPHLTGQAVDIAKHGLSRTEVAWMRGYLLPLIQEGKIDVEEEFQQACFHISVYKKYLPPADVPKRDLASHRRSEANALATAIQ